jgi:hypothetical protein
VHIQDRPPPCYVRPVENDLPVESTRSKKGRVEHIGSVGRGDDDDIRAAVESIHLDQDLVERLLALIVTSAQTCAALPANGIDLIDEDDAWGALLSLIEEIAHAAGADTYEHFDELGT